MNASKQSNKPNPLMNFMRQPKIYIKLPSNGTYWPAGSIVIPDNNELAVYSMTANDELLFKTPDALFNGQSIVDVIQSCIPSIKDAWKTPNIDLDAILIAIRIATYGERMDITHVIPNTTEEVTHGIDLRTLLDQLYNVKWEETVKINEELTCFVAPLTYKHTTLASMKTFETKRLIQAVNDEKLTDEQKLEIFNKSFKAMSEVTLTIVVDSITAIQTLETVVEDKGFIKEFLQNVDTSLYKKIEDHIKHMKSVLGIKPFEIESTPEQVKMGAPAKYQLPIQLDTADFFGRGS
jgi:hypothetical protein